MWHITVFSLCAHMLENYILYGNIFWSFTWCFSVFHRTQTWSKHLQMWTEGTTEECLPPVRDGVRPRHVCLSLKLESASHLSRLSTLSFSVLSRLIEKVLNKIQHEWHVFIEYIIQTVIGRGPLWPCGYFTRLHWITGQCALSWCVWLFGYEMRR